MDIKIVIEGQEKSYAMVSDTPISFDRAMESLGLSYNRPCGGRGRCMNCAVRFSYGAPDITVEDERALSYKEIKDGWRLGCRCTITSDCRILVPAKLVQGLAQETQSDADRDAEAAGLGLAAAVDIGTTTIGVAILSAETGQIIASTNVTNSQRKFGADVMSRIQAAAEGHSDELAACVRSDILKGAWTLMSDLSEICDVAIAGNTTMLHLALGYPVQGMASYPFTPYTTAGEKHVEIERTIFNMPCISAFIGGDIVAGLYYLNMGPATGRSLFVDLGTNAEIVLFDGNRYWAASAAAGPALEAGCISCGVASVEGAINHITMVDGRCQISTIAGAPANGICGSGVIDAVYELHKAGIIDDGGLFNYEHSEGFELTDSLLFTPEDVQQVLLAKSAVYAAVTVLLQQAGMKADDVEHLYVAGGLGASLRPESLFGMGMLPEELRDRYEAVGNTALLGAARYAVTKDDAALSAIIDATTVVELGGMPEFEQLFLEHLRL